MSAHVKSLAGQEFGRLTVIKMTDKRSSDKCVIWECLCSCGKRIEVAGARLTSGNVKSCGCLRSDVSREKLLKHGLRKHPLYQVWSDMKQRCNNAGNDAYKNYGGRGISVCEEWNGDFEAFYEWAMINNYRKGMELDRANNDDGYSPNNCRFVDRKTNARNRRSNVNVTYNNKEMTLAEVVEITGIKYGTLWNRIIIQGMTVEQATRLA